MNRYLFLLLLSWIVTSQKSDDYQVPLDIPLDLSGSFGELRSNHFHAGVDIKTRGKTGLKVYSVADGYISRIKIATTGYGKAFYVTHPNGYTTVYAHLLKGSEKIEAYIKAIQYKKQSYEIQCFPAPNELVVKKGEVIAYSGNSGSSAGPHLHFEFRDTKTEKVINPMQFGIKSKIKDHYKPKVYSLYLYRLDANNKTPELVTLKRDKNGQYYSSTIYAEGAIGFGVVSYDYCTNKYNKNGLYRVESFLNGSPSFLYQMDTFSFAESRKINSYIDYKSFKKRRTRIQQLFVQHQNPVSVIKNSTDNGIVRVSQGEDYLYRIELEDFFGNKNTINLSIKYRKQKVNQELIKPIEGMYLIDPDRDYLFEKDGVSVYIPEHSFDQSFDFSFAVEQGKVKLHKDVIPLYKNVTLRIPVPDSITHRNNYFIGRIKSKKTAFVRTTISKGFFVAKTKQLGSYKLCIDTIAPKVYSPNFKKGQNISALKKLQVKIYDQHSGIKSYNMYINNQWVLAEYDPKTRVFFHPLSELKYKKGQNHFKVVLEDYLNNSTIFESNFFVTK